MKLEKKTHFPSLSRANHGIVPLDLIYTSKLYQRNEVVTLLFFKLDVYVIPSPTQDRTIMIKVALQLTINWMRIKRGFSIDLGVIDRVAFISTS